MTESEAKTRAIEQAESFEKRYAKAHPVTMIAAEAAPTKANQYF